MNTLTNVLNPPIEWRYYMLYWRMFDGRIFYFRGQRRRKLFIRDITTDWVSVPEKARLFSEKPNLSDTSCYAKTLKNLEVSELHFAGFHGIVLRSHLIMPEKIKRVTRSK